MRCALQYGVVYLHGFASHPGSEKGVFFRTHFEKKGVPFIAPALDGGDFAGMTVTKILSRCERAVAELDPKRALVILGSSLGGLVAALYAERHQREGKRPAALVLIAPAFELGSLWRKRLGPERLAQWKQAGELALRDERGAWVYGEAYPKIGYPFYEDVLQYERPKWTFPTPTLVFHGAKDEQVPLEGSQRFADAANVQLVIYGQGAHSLSESLGDMQRHIDGFLTARQLVADRESKQAP